MVKFKKKKNTFWHSPLVLFVLLAILVFFSFKIWDLYQRYQQTRQMKKMAEEEYNLLTKRIDDLNEDISELNTEEGKEGIIRVKYQVAKEGEKVLNIVEEDDIVETEEDTVPPQKSFWSSFGGLFQKKN